MSTRMKWSGRMLWGLAAVLALGLSATRADAILLSVLESTNGTITVDDKIFSNFSVNVIGSGTFNPPDGSGIDVTGQSIDAQHQMLIFQGGFRAGFGPGGGAGDADYFIQYTVTTTNGLPLINDIELSFDGVVIDPLGTASVAEQALVNGNLVGSVFVNTPNNLGTNSVLLAGGPFTSVTVNKDIQLSASAGGLTTISTIRQTISQVSVPEPMSVLLLGAGLAAIGVWKRRQGA